MSAPSLTLYQYPGTRRDTTLSPPCGKALMALRFKGCDFAIRNLRSPGQVRRINPRGRVPALRIDGLLVVDSSDILDALEAHFPDPPLEPVDPRDRVQARLWEDWADEVLYFQAVWHRWMQDDSFARMKQTFFAGMPVPLRWVVPPVARRLVRRRLRGQGTGDKPADVVRREFRASLEMLDAWLHGVDWLAGPRLSRADLAVVAVLDQLLDPEVPPAMTDALDTHPRLRAWRARVHERVPSAAG